MDWSLVRRVFRITREEGLMALVSRTRASLSYRGKLALKQWELYGRSILGPVEYDTIRLDLSHPEVSARVRRAIVRGVYESGEAELIREQFQDAEHVIVLGGGLGYLASVVAQACNPELIIVVEANPMLLPLLQRTKELNDAQYTIIQAAYAPNKDLFELNIGRDHWSGSGYRDLSETATVGTTSIGTLRSRFELDTFSLIMDIEGGESAIPYEIEELEQYCERFVVEFHDTKPEFEHFASEIEAARETLEDSSLRFVRSAGGAEAFENRNYD